jgi:molecular chaperone DnaK
VPSRAPGPTLPNFSQEKETARRGWDMSYAVGIDLGTTFTAAAIFTRGGTAPFPLGDRSLAVPSVAFVREHELLFGDDAVIEGETKPAQLQREFKRVFGQDAPLISGNRRITADELMGKLAAWTLRRVTTMQGESPGRVVFTCPANWREGRKTRLIAAIQTEVKLDKTPIIVSEPEAAAFHYASLRVAEGRDVPAGAIIAVYDLGGGTFDTAILRKTPTKFELVGKACGVDNLGGVDIDRMLFERVLESIGVRLHDFDRNDLAISRQIAALRQSVILAKERLSETLEAEVAVTIGSVVTTARITRRELEAVAAPLIEQTLLEFEYAVASANTTMPQLHSVLLVGAASRMPLVSYLIRQRATVDVAVDTHPKFAVCQGAAIYAAAQMGTIDLSRLVTGDDLPAVSPANRGVTPVADLPMSPITIAPPRPVAPSNDLPEIQPVSHYQATPIGVPTLPAVEPPPRPAKSAPAFDGGGLIADLDATPVAPTRPVLADPPTIVVPAPLDSPMESPAPWESPNAPRTDLPQVASTTWPSTTSEVDRVTTGATALGTSAGPTMLSGTLLQEVQKLELKVDFVAAGLLGLADVPVAPVIRVDMDVGARLKQADAVRIGGDAQFKRKSPLPLVIGIVIALAVLIAALVLLGEKSGGSTISYTPTAHDVPLRPSLSTGSDNEGAF